MNNEASFEEAIALLQSGNFALAKECLTNLVRKSPHEARLRHALGIAYLYLGKPQEALSEFSSSLLGDHPTPDPARNMAELYKYLGDIEAAKSVTKINLERFKDDAGLKASYEMLHAPDANRRTPLTASWLECKDYIDIHERVILGSGSSVDIKYKPYNPGIKVRIGADSQIFGTLSLQRPEASISIGERTQIGSSLLIASQNIEIGDDVLMAWNCTLMDNDSHPTSWEDRKNDVLQCGYDFLVFPTDFSRNKDWSKVNAAPIKIENKAWIGFGVAILKGVTIGEGAIIGAQSVVTKNIPPYTIAAGNPARVIKEIPR